MARRLAKFLQDEEIHIIKHTTAVRAVAAILGFNEHSMSAAVKKGIEIDMEVTNDRGAYIAGLEDAHAAMCTCSEGIRESGCDCRAASILRRIEDEVKS